MQKPQFTGRLPAPGVSGQLEDISASPSRWGRDPLSPCTLRLSWILKWCPLTCLGLLLLCWIPWRQETVGWQEICFTTMWPSSFFSSKKELDLCWMCLTSCRRVGPYTSKTFFFYHSDYISQEISIHKHTPFACALHNIGLLLLFPARILHQLSEMDMQPLYCAKPPRKSSF